MVAAPAAVANLTLKTMLPPRPVPVTVQASLVLIVVQFPANAGVPLPETLVTSRPAGAVLIVTDWVPLVRPVAAAVIVGLPVVLSP